MWQNWVSNPVARVHTVIHSTVVLSIRAGLLVKIEPNASALLCFQGNLCTKSLKILEPSESFFFLGGGEPSESFEMYLIPKLTAVHIYL